MRNSWQKVNFHLSIRSLPSLAVALSPAPVTWPPRNIQLHPVGSGSGTWLVLNKFDIDRESKLWEAPFHLPSGPIKKPVAAKNSMVWFVSIRFASAPVDMADVHTIGAGCESQIWFTTVSSSASQPAVFVDSVGGAGSQLLTPCRIAGLNENLNRQLARLHQC